MTGQGQSSPAQASPPGPSLLPFDPADLLTMRVLPAELSRMVGVSKQTVSQWIKKGILALGPDGRLDPVRAVRTLIDSTEPSRLRARLLRQASADHHVLRQRVSDLEGALATATAEQAYREQAVAFREQDRAAVAVARLLDAIHDGFDEACQAHAAGHLLEWLDEVAAVAYYEQDPDEYRRLCAEGDAPAEPGEPGT